MKPILNRNRGRQGIVLWVLVVIFVIFVVIVGGIALSMIKALQKLVPPPPPPDNVYPVPGDPYGGGITVGYAPGPDGPADYQPQSELPKDTSTNSKTFYIYAGDWPTPESMTNLIWSGSLDDLTNQIGTNGLPLEQFPAGQQPPHRFYNIMRDQ